MTFKNYLEEVCFEDNGMVLDDDMPDFFNNWLTDLQVDDWLEYGDKFVSQKPPVEPHNAV
jgi:hypothetical protein